jgi:hypothetical protein
MAPGLNPPPGIVSRRGLQRGKQFNRESILTRREQRRSVMGGAIQPRWDCSKVNNLS